jgi:predicted transglutaminase-like protease
MIAIFLEVMFLELIIIISQMGVFQGNDHRYVVNENFDKNHFQMEDAKICEVRHFLTFHFKCFWLTNHTKT